MEDYEKFLVQVSKKAKVGTTPHPALHACMCLTFMSPCCKVDLMKNFKRSTARDFKINSATVTAKLAEEMEDDVRMHTHAHVCTHTLLAHTHTHTHSLHTHTHTHTHTPHTHTHSSHTHTPHTHTLLTHTHTPHTHTLLTHTHTHARVHCGTTFAGF